MGLAMVLVLVCWATTSAQIPTEFRSPEIPGLRSLGGQLIGNPTTPQTRLQTVTQENQLRAGQNSQFPEYQFGNTPAGQFEELPTQGLEQGTLRFDNQMSIRSDQGGYDPPAIEDPNFNGFTPKTSRSEGSFEFQSGVGSSQPQEFDSESLQNGISDFFGNRSGLQESETSRGDGLSSSRSEDLLEQLPPAMDETPSGASPDQAGRTDRIIQRFPNGKKRIVRTVAQDEAGNFSNHGPWEAFDIKGNSVAAGVFKRGVMQGQWRRQHDKSEGGLFATKPFNLFQGPYLSVANFKDGKLDGLWTIYDRFRSKIFEITYTKGVRNGTATWWYPNRAKMREATFKDGLLDGKILGWDDAEKLTREEEYVQGRRIVRNVTFYRPRKPKQEEYFLDSKLEPEGEDSWWDAKPTPYLPRGSKVQNGGAAQWYENGQLKHQGQFKQGEPIGRFVWWHANGNKSIQGMYAQGKKTRTWTWWHENGMKKTEGNYDDDLPVGVWRAWYADGTLRNEETFPGNKRPQSPDYETTDPELGSELSSQEGSGQSVIEPNSAQMEEIEELPEELPQPEGEPLGQQDTEALSDPTAEIEGHDFGDKKSEVGSESFRDPTDPRDIDPFGEIDSGSDGSIPEEHFNQPDSGFFRPPAETGNGTKPEGRSVSDPFGDKLFQAPKSDNLTTLKPKTSPAALNR